ncbi:hypothetical protein [Microbacterium sp. KSW4-4]|uniref:hypothetical protein n=1 Tax=Microbacterium sp. KSW4-4 TaxID=2851651 RepID=UPI001FFD3EB0|nr:hypothetical protein [Microbacterium sp. KSW4-4]MCK2032208.1 hypothetical protein [Microbacterium sp. KSW4-4]
MTRFERATASDEGDLSATELAKVCEALLAAWHEDASRSRHGAAPRSASDLDAASVRSAFPQGLPDNLEYAHGQMAGQMVDAIMLQLQSVVTLLRADPMIPLGLWPLVRSEIEYAGRVAWLLEPFPGVDVGRLRVARGMLEHLAAIQRQRFTAGKWNGQRAKQFKTKREELLKRIRGLFDEVRTPLEKPQQIDEWQIGAEKMLPLGQSVSLFLDHLLNGDALYDVFSDNSHPSVVSLAFQSSRSDVEGVTSMTYPAIPRVINFQVRLGCLTAYKSAQMILGYYGFPMDALEKWAIDAPSQWFEGPTA